MILDDIVAHKRLEIAARKKQLPQHELEQRLGQIEVPRNFLEALRTRRSAVSDQQSAINHKQSEIGNRKSKI